ncbi:MAG: hypothetical protein NXI31_12590 [bacterium]|nr:hypothetical protein [bacterium]
MIQAARVLLPTLLLACFATGQGKNVLFYGNSYTYYSWGYGVPELVGLIATEAGHPTPNIVQRLVGGQTLQYFATDPGEIAQIGTLLPANETWDEIVIQGHQLEATNGIGFNSAVFHSSVHQIMANVRSHSPAARAVMFQTWANAWGHMYYPVPWPTPVEMHDEIRGNYQLVVDDLNTSLGAGSAVNAAPGDGVALLEWDPQWFEADKAHPSPAMILLAAMTIYSSIYGQPVCDIQAAFNPAGPLATLLATKSLGQTEWNFLAGIADRTAAPATRHYPGSGDYLLLETATDLAPLTSCPKLDMTTNTVVQMQMRSLNGVYDQAGAWLLVDLFQTGSPPGPDVQFPELQVAPGRMALLLSAGDLNAPLSFTFPMPFSWPGSSVLVQGLAWGPSAETGNAFFTTTDAHEFVFF